MSYSFEHDIYYVKKNYSKISFDLTKIKNQNKIFDAYHISPNETIIAYVKSPVFLVPLTMSGVIITDKGLYLISGIFETEQKNKLPFEELCKYAFSKDGEKSALVVSNLEFSKVLWESSLIGKNVIGDELLQFLSDLQQYFLKNYSWAVKQHDELANGAIAKGKNELKCCSMSKEVDGILYSLLNDDKYINQVAKLVAERLYRKNGTLEVNTYIAKLFESPVSSNIPTAIKKAIDCYLKDFIRDFIKDISDISLSFDYNYLKTVLDNITFYIDENDNHIDSVRLSAYLYARIGDIDGFREAQRVIRTELGTKEAFSLEIFKCIMLNALMKSRVDSINNDELPNVNFWKLKDNFGFDILHYALIFGNAQLVERITQNLSFTMDEESSNDALHQIYDYNVIAALCNSSDKYSICASTSPYVQSQMKIHKSLKRRLKLKEIQIQIQQNVKSQYSKAMREASTLHNREQFEKYRDNVRNSENLIKQTIKEKEEIQREIFEFENDLDSSIKQTLDKASKTAYALMSSDNDYLKFIVSLVRNPQKFSEMLNQSSYKYLYIYNKLSFVSSEELNIKHFDINELNNIGNEFDDFWSEEEAEFEDNENVTQTLEKPYGDSWFSDEAHKNESVLKEEYRKLAKIYHPDVSDNPNSNIVFQEINNERAEILDSLE